MPEQSTGGPLTERQTPPRVQRPSSSDVPELLEQGLDPDVDVIERHAGDVETAVGDDEFDAEFGAGAELEAAPAGDERSDAVPQGSARPRTRPVVAAVETWRRELAGSDANETLLTTGPGAASSWLDLTHAHPNGLAQLFAARPTRLSSLFREPAAHAVARKQAREIRTSALLLAARSGVHGSCLAIGMATWQPVDEEFPVLAPLVLRGCAVRPRGAGHDDYDLDLDDAVVINPELVRVLGETYDVDADGGHLASLTHGHKGFDPRPVYAWLEERCARVPQFRIERTLILATFSAGSGAVLADLDAALPAIASHDLLARISRALAAPPSPAEQPESPPAPPPSTSEAADGVRTSSPARDGRPVQAPPAGPTGAGDSRRLAMIGRLGPRGAVRPVRPPQEPDPEDELLVLDLDPAQQQAVEAALGHSHVVVEGPPGSGGTQVAAAAVAGLVTTGRRVLILSPRRSSTEALLSRLDAAGLGDLVLDLQDAAGSRSGSSVGATVTAIRTALAAVGQELARTGPRTESSPAASPVPAQPGAPLLEVRATRVDDPTDSVGRLRRARELLDGAAEALHEIRSPWSVSAYQAMVALAELRGAQRPPRTQVRLSGDVLTALDVVTRERLRVHLQAAARAGAFTFSKVETRWFDARVGTESQARAALDAAVALRAGLERAREVMAAVTADAGLRAAPDAAGWLPLLEVLLSVRATVDQLMPEIYEQPLDDLVDATAPRAERTNAGRSRGERRRLRRQAQNLVRPGVHVPRLHAALLEARHQLNQWAQLTETGETPHVVVGLTDAALAVEPVTAALDVLASAFEGTDTPDPRRMPLDELEQRVFDLAGDAQGILGQPRRATLVGGLRSAGLGALVDDLRERRVEQADVDTEFDLAWWSSVLDSVVAVDPRLARHDPETVRQAAADLRAAETERIADGSRRVRQAVLERAGDLLIKHADQTRLLHEELQREDRTPRLVDLVRRAGDALGALCPVWVMSPDTVAACLPLPAPASSAGQVATTGPAAAAGIDTVVIDDAGHVALAEVAASLARFRRVVAVGDRRRQVVPSGARSVLDAVAPFAVECRLDRDHRARDGRVLVPLAPSYPEGWQLTPGVAVVPPLRLETVTDGIAVPLPGEETPLSADAEVRRVVDLIAAHAARHPAESLAVVTFGDRHAERIEETLRNEVTDRPGLARWLAEHWRDGVAEPLVVGPVQRLLGVERDAAIVSVGLARTPHGRVLHRFDVLDGDQGASLLLMAMSRARRRTTVIACFTGDDLVVDRLRTDGARLLRDVLLAAGGRGAASAGRTSATVDGLVADLRDRLATAGLPVQSRVGDGAWPLDIAVADLRIAGRMLVAVDLDGPDFASRPARERERQRPERWERAGWAYCKVSALDLFRDPALEVERIRSAWHGALSALPVTTEMPAVVHVEGVVEDPVMSAPGTSDVPQNAGPATDSDGPVLPQQTTDDTDAGWSEPAGGDVGPGGDIDPDGDREPTGDDERLLREKPPHYE